MARRLVIALVTALALLAFAIPAAAKERAVTRFDSLPDQFTAGRAYSLGYTIRMDDVDPLKVDRTEIVLRSSDGRSYSFAGTPEGAAGHYVATVTFPAAGTYEWSVTQGNFFAPMPLPAVTVLAAPVTTSSAGGPSAAEPIGTALPLGIAVVAAFIALGFGIFSRRRATTAA
jgi:hypothetical protein